MEMNERCGMPSSKATSSAFRENFPAMDIGVWAGSFGAKESW
jgi:hypothetical protein